MTRIPLLALSATTVVLFIVTCAACDNEPDLSSLPFAEQCVPESTVEVFSTPDDAGFSSADVAQIDSVVLAAIADSAFPGAAVAIGRSGGVAYLQGYGKATYNASAPDISPTSIYDLASMTKVVSTTTATMLLVESGAISLDDYVVKYLPEFAPNGKEHITLKHLLTHTSGLIPFRPFHTMGIHDRESVLSYIMQDTLQFPPGERVSYSDLGMITMGRVIEKASGMRLQDFAQQYVFNPLGMCDTHFRTQEPGDNEDIVPTEYDSTFRKTLVHGVVHDETAFILGGTAGHAGLFSTAADLARFGQMMLSGGTMGDLQFLREETITSFTSRPEPGGQMERAIGWDMKSLGGYSSSGRYFSLNSFGHTGYTGTSIWFDPDNDIFAIMLTNRVHPTRANRKISAVRPAFADAVALGMIAD